MNTTPDTKHATESGSAETPCSASSLTPDTNALADEIYARGIKVSEIKMLQHARTLERERDAALATIMEIEEIYIDGCDTYEDWKAMGERPKCATRKKRPRCLNSKTN